MKTLNIFLVSVLIFMSALVANSQTAVSCEKLQAAENLLKENLHRYESVWDDIVNNGNIDAINESNFTKDVTMIVAPENIVGIEAFKAYYQNFLTGFSDINFTINEAFGKGGKLAKQWTFKGTHTGDFFGIPATGRMVDLSGVTITEMRNGKIAREQDFFDNAVFMQQLGLTSNPNNIAVIDKLYQDFGKGDVPAVLASLDSKVVWNEAEGNALADGNPYIGPDAVLNGVFVRVINNHEYFHLKDIQLHDMSNNQVLSTLRYEGKVASNGEVYNAQAAHLWTLRDGKVIAFQQYVDTKKLADTSVPNSKSVRN